MGYVIVTALAFVLGILATLICVHIRNIREMDKTDKEKQ